MTHAEIERLLGAYMDGELSPRQRQAIAVHLGQCPDCLRQVEEMRGLSSRLQDWPAFVLPAEQEHSFCRHVMQQLPARRAPAAAGRATPRSFILPAGIVLTGAFVESAALITAILSIVVATGLLGGTFMSIDQSLAEWLQSPGATVAQYTWSGQIVMRIMDYAGINGAQVSQWGAAALGILLPATALFVFAIVAFLGLSGWAGWQLSRRRV